MLVKTPAIATNVTKTHSRKWVHPWTNGLKVPEIHKQFEMASGISKGKIKVRKAGLFDHPWSKKKMKHKMDETLYGYNLKTDHLLDIKKLKLPEKKKKGGIGDI